MNLFSAYLIGTAVDELRQETKKDIQALIDKWKAATAEKKEAKGA